MWFGVRLQTELVAAESFTIRSSVFSREADE
jgi:hypothetical protein